MRFGGNGNDSLFTELVGVRIFSLFLEIGKGSYSFVETLKSFFEAFTDVPFVDLNEELLLRFDLVGLEELKSKIGLEINKYWGTFTVF